MATTNTITQFGVTFTFGGTHEYGTFANGDYWVVGPVTITSMTPDWDGTTNGWQLNPLHEVDQGFYAGGFDYSASQRPDLPWVVSSGSVVKVIGAGAGTESVIKTAVVLTVLTETPPDGTGAGYFRPPYSGTQKPLIATSAMRTDLLPSFSAVGSEPTLAAVEASFSKCLRMDHKSISARQFRPVDAMEDYQPKNTIELNEAMLRLMLDDDISAKMPALIQFTQHALDRAYIVEQGYRSSANSGHNPCHRVLAAWGAWMLDLSSVKAALSTAGGFHEDEFLYLGSQGLVLWGAEGSEESYLTYINTGSGSRSIKDPYEYIDGGDLTDGPGGAAYQMLTSQALKGQAAVFRLFPDLQAAFPPENDSEGRNSFYNLSTYGERWTKEGTLASPDPYSRFLDQHNENIDGGSYRSQFVADMWRYHIGGLVPYTPTNLTVTAI